MTRGRPALRYPARGIIGGYGEGEALVTLNSLSFWGGVDPSTGVVTDAHHEWRGVSVAGKVLVFPWGAGSSSGCGVLMEMVRCRTNPAAIINLETEAVLALGPIIAEELYGRSFPIVTVEQAVFDALITGDYLKVDGTAGQIVKIPRKEQQPCG
ncbi:MAG: DUF126 domain-containing protein [Bacillota bacterium]|nr:DUF126 domain-containing protein [Bacillota bacterium]